MAINTNQLIGKKFGKLTVIERNGNDSQGHRSWLCKCDCGNYITVTGSNLIRGKPDHTTSCGCESKPIDEIGNKYGHLTVIKYAGGGKKTSALWLCECDCGGAVTASGTKLRIGNIKSCGCGHVERGKDGAFFSLFNQIRSGARRRGIEFSLSPDDIYHLTKLNCTYCGIEPRQELKYGSSKSVSYVYNGIDRVDNSKGYIIENCVTCCGFCNRAKNSHDIDEFKDWICNVYKNWAGG